MEEALLQKYPPAFPPDDDVVEDKPAMVRDVRGRHLAWYLPGAMSEGLQACHRNIMVSILLTLSVVRIAFCLLWKIFGHTLLSRLPSRVSPGETTRHISGIPIILYFHPVL